ncbi:MAG TPA: threonine-phosphate decarboxylase CobD [Nitrospiraceae bacterium]|nr:threonine-phosphate decarboxylase CobD [Nitrospiraceae bacterium]
MALMTGRHGGNIYEAARETGRSLTRIIDFSASINPLGPSPRAVRAMTAALRLASHYPEPDCIALRRALADRHGLIPEQILMGNGSSEIIQLLPRALSLRSALIIGPTFSEYERAILLEGGQTVWVNATRAEQYRVPILDAIRTIRNNRTKVDAVFVCNPNSPTGQGVSPDDIGELVETVSHCGGWTIIDETFVDYCEAHSVLPQLNRHSRVVILRSFTKFYALPGLRIGYAVGDEKTVARMRVWQPPWSVNTLAQVAALSSMNDVSYARRSRRFMSLERARLFAALRTLNGLVVFSSLANFLLVELPPPHTAVEVAGRLYAQGILVRDCSATAGLTARTIRVAVRTPEQNRRFIRALRRLLRGHV